MIIFINEDRAYRSWITHHRQAFVLDGRRKPKLSHLTMHRATCCEIKCASSTRSYWTTGAKLKACSLHRDELETWSTENTQAPPSYCPSCQPNVDDTASHTETIHLTKLGKDILDYILDAALIHMEHEYPSYHLTAGDIAACFGKTSGQISAGMHRLVEGGFVTMRGKTRATSPTSPRTIVLPTVLAIRTLEAFECDSDSTIQSELAKLEPA